MTMGMLIFGRSSHDTKKIVGGPDDGRVVRADESGEVVAALQAQLDAAHSVAAAEVEHARQHWLANQVVTRVRVVEQVKTGTFKSEDRYHDELTVDGETQRLSAGSAPARAEQLSRERFPAPKLSRVSVIPGERVRTWTGKWYTADDEVMLQPPDELAWEYGLPTGWILREMDTLIAQGWSLRHVGEDHGLYAGADAHDEAFVARIRYLFERA